MMIILCQCFLLKVSKHFLSQNTFFEKHSDKQEATYVKTVALSNWTNHRNINKVTYLTIDVEGHESLVIQVWIDDLVTLITFM